MKNSIYEIYGGYMTITLGGTILAAAKSCIPRLKLRRDELVHKDLHDPLIPVVTKALKYWEDIALTYKAYLRQTCMIYVGDREDFRGEWAIRSVSEDGCYAHCSNETTTHQWISMKNLRTKENR